MSRRDLDAADAIHAAAAFVRAIEMTTRDTRGNHADPKDANAIAAVSHAALDKLNEALRLLTVKGESA